MVTKYQIGSIVFTVGSFQKITEAILTKINAHSGIVVLPCSLNDLASLHQNPNLLPIYQTVDLCVTDGMPLVWWLRRKKTTQIVDRIYGPTLMEKILIKTQDTAIHHAFYGTTKKTLKSLKVSMHQIAPRITIATMLAPPPNAQIEKLDSFGLERIKKTQPTVLWIGVNSPKQVILAARWKRSLPHTVIFCVGAAFDIVAGVKPQSPLWMQHLGLEWLFRFVTEPQRLFKRYFIDIPIFLLASAFSAFLPRLRRT